MTPEESAVIKAALKWHKVVTGQHSSMLTINAERHLLDATHALYLSRQPLHTVEPVPCMVYANNSATMFCILPKGHPGSEPDDERFEVTRHVGYPGGVRGTGPNGGSRVFDHWPHFESMERHERPACARFPGCTRHPKREAEQ